MGIETEISSAWMLPLLVWIIGGPIWARFSRWKPLKDSTPAQNKRKMLTLVIVGGPLLWIIVAILVQVKKRRPG